MGRWRGAAAAGMLAAAMSACGAPAATPVSRSPTTPAGPTASGCRAVHTDYTLHRSRVWVTLAAVVTRLLSDSHGQYVHQRFIVRCPAGQTVLIVNDVSIGQRAPVSLGGTVQVKGQYIWDSQGGLVHFTHHDYAGGEGGWIIWRGHTYADGTSAWTSLRTKWWIRTGHRGTDAVPRAVV